jgi:polysaccharide export outer membrane protein
MKLFNRKRYDFTLYPLLFFIPIPLFILLQSCVTHRNLEYLKDKNNTFKTFNEASITDYRIKSKDELFIQISSIDEAAANIFAGSNVQQTYYMSSIDPYGASLISYTVDKEGFLVLPVIGRISVKDKTIIEVTELIKGLLNNILSQPVVTVKLVNRYVSVLGEVNNPGHYPYAQDKLTIFDAIGLAGDITIFGDRNAVVLTRNENGKNIRIIVDLSRSEILSSDYYYLRPNDLIYVKPMRKRFWGFDEFPYAVILSTITTGLLIYTIIEQ